MTDSKNKYLRRQSLLEIRSIELYLRNKVKNYFIKIPHEKTNKSIVKTVKDYNKQRPLGAKPQICYVPANNILFSKDGKVLACSYNQQHVIGTYGIDSIENILISENRKLLIEKHNKNDLSFGCQYCLNFIQSKKYNGLKSFIYDKFSESCNLNSPKVLEFDLSSRCNLNCIMCNEKNRELNHVNGPYNESFIEEIAHLLRDADELKFYGGEPFMISIYYKIWEKAVAVNPRVKIFIVTNGTILDDKIKDLLNRGNFEITVSIDSLQKDVFEKIRQGASFEKVMSNFQWYLEYCQIKNNTLSLSMTIFRENWKDIPEVISFCNESGCSVFFSYLYNPKNMSLWTFTSKEIAVIIIFLEQYSFQRKTKIQEYNSDCYKDIIEHLKFWRDKNNETLIKSIETNEVQIFTNRIHEHFVSVSKKSASESLQDAMEMQNRIESLLIKLGHSNYTERVFAEFNKIAADDFISYYFSIPENKFESALSAWLYSCIFD